MAGMPASAAASGVGHDPAGTYATVEPSDDGEDIEAETVNDTDGFQGFDCPPPGPQMAPIQTQCGPIPFFGLLGFYWGEVYTGELEAVVTDDGAEQYTVSCVIVLGSLQACSVEGGFPTGSDLTLECFSQIPGTDLPGGVGEWDCLILSF